MQIHACKKGAAGVGWREVLHCSYLQIGRLALSAFLACHRASATLDWPAQATHERGKSPGMFTGCGRARVFAFRTAFTDIRGCGSKGALAIHTTTRWPRRYH